MGSLLGGKKSKTSSPKNYSSNFASPLGNYAYNRKAGGAYTPNVSQDFWSAFNTGDQKLNQTVQGLPTSFNVNDYYNNPFYESAKSLYTAPIQRQYQQDQTEMQNNLNARNQLGSSFEALMQRDLMQGRDYNLQAAENTARQSSADAYGNSINQALSTLAGLTNSRASLQDQLYAPLKIALGQQANVNQMQSTANNFVSNQNAINAQGGSGFDKLLKYWQSNAQTLAAASTAACWVAREVYGTQNPKWVEFRHWLLNKAPDDVRAFYLENGPHIAENIKGDEVAKIRLKRCMDNLLEAA
jgi:hypothetical protein